LPQNEAQEGCQQDDIIDDSMVDEEGKGQQTGVDNESVPVDSGGKSSRKTKTSIKPKKSSEKSKTSVKPKKSWKVWKSRKSTSSNSVEVSSPLATPRSSTALPSPPIDLSQNEAQEGWQQDGIIDDSLVDEEGKGQQAGVDNESFPVDSGGKSSRKTKASIKPKKSSGKSKTSVKPKKSRKSTSSNSVEVSSPLATPRSSTALPSPHIDLTQIEAQEG
jgi:hypothetical protein